MKIVASQFIKPFVLGQKNDSSDAQGIAVASMKPTMKFVPTKSQDQLDIQALHRARQCIVNYRIATMNQIRGLLLDRGIVIRKTVSRFRNAVPLILEDASNELSIRIRRAIAQLYELMRDLDTRIKYFDKEIEVVFEELEACQRISHLAKQKHPVMPDRCWQSDKKLKLLLQYGGSP